MSNAPSNMDDVIDSRDVIARIEELVNIVQNDAQTADEAAELIALEKLAEEAEGADDWAYGVTLVRDSYFRRHAMELAEDVVDMRQAERWPFHHIDWDAAAEELKADYFDVEFDGVTYWVR